MTDNKPETINWDLPFEQFVTELKNKMDTSMKNKCISLPLKETIDSIKLFYNVFKCERCGKCCQYAPETNPDENVILFLPHEYEYARKFLSRRQQRKHFRHTQRGYLCSYPCPFLNGKACSIYKDRPIVCRQYPLSPQSDKVGLLMVNSACPAGYKVILGIWAGAHKADNSLWRLRSHDS